MQTETELRIPEYALFDMDCALLDIESFLAGHDDNRCHFFVYDGEHEQCSEVENSGWEVVSIEGAYLELSLQSTSSLESTLRQRWHETRMQLATLLAAADSGDAGMLRQMRESARTFLKDSTLQ